MASRVADGVCLGSRGFDRFPSRRKEAYSLLRYGTSGDAMPLGCDRLIIGWTEM